MTLTLVQSTAQALVDAITAEFDGGANGSARGTGRVLFENTGSPGTAIATLDNNNTGNNILSQGFVAATAADPSVAAINNGPWEDSGETVAGTINVAIFEDTNDDEVFRADVGSGSEDIQMANPTVALNDPVRLSTYNIQVALAN